MMKKNLALIITLFAFDAFTQDQIFNFRTPQFNDSVSVNQPAEEYENQNIQKHTVSNPSNEEISIRNGVPGSSDFLKPNLVNPETVVVEDGIPGSPLNDYYNTNQQELYAPSVSTKTPTGRAPSSIKTDDKQKPSNATTHTNVTTPTTPGNNTIPANVNTTTAAAAAAAAAPSSPATTPVDPCVTFKKLHPAKELQSTNGNNEDQDGGNGTPEIQECVKLSKGAMRHIYKSGRSSAHWPELIHNECLSDAKICDDNALNECTQKLGKKAARCDAAAFIIYSFDKDWTSPDDVKRNETKGGVPEIKCMTAGIETVDYVACAKFVNNGSIMDVAQVALQGGQELYYKDKSMTAQAELASNPNTATAALEALKGDAKSQQDMMTQRAAMDTGKFAALASYYSSIPTNATLQSKCDEYRSPPELKSFKGCEYAINENKFSFLLNQRAKEAMKAKLVKAGIDVASDVAMAALMAKRVGDIKDAIAKVDEFVPIDPLAPTFDNLQTTYCQQNPGDPKCLTGGLDRTFDAMGENIITFGEGGTGTSYANNNPYLEATPTTTNAVNPTGLNNATEPGSIIASAPQNGGLADAAAAATVSKGNTPSGGGGGGGVGSGGGGGGGAGLPPAAQAGATSATQGKAPSYTGGAGTLSMMGGYGNKGKTAAKDDANPFGKLFKDNGKSGAIDFGRSPSSQKVGNKGDNLFEMISKRYSNVSNEKRLIEYEMTK